MNEQTVENQEQKSGTGQTTDSAPKSRIKRYMVEHEGRELLVSFDPQTTLTIVHNYAPGRSLIFKGSELNAVSEGNVDKKFLDLNIGVVVENQELEEHSPLQLWNEMRRAQTKGA